MGKRLCIALAAGVLLPLAALALYAAVTRIDPNPKRAVGEQLDELNGVAIYYNGGVNTVQDRNLTSGRIQPWPSPLWARCDHCQRRYRHAARPISLGLQHF